MPLVDAALNTAIMGVAIQERDDMQGWIEAVKERQNDPEEQFQNAAMWHLFELAGGSFLSAVVFFFAANANFLPGFLPAFRRIPEAQAMYVVMCVLFFCAGGWFTLRVIVFNQIIYGFLPSNAQQRLRPWLNSSTKFWHLYVFTMSGALLWDLYSRYLSKLTPLILSMPPAVKISAAVILVSAVVVLIALSRRIYWPGYWRGLPHRFLAALNHFKYRAVLVFCIFPASMLLSWYGSYLHATVSGMSFDHLFSLVDTVLPYVGYLLGSAVLIGFLAAVFLNNGHAPINPADWLRDQKTYGDAKPADAQSVDEALRGNSANDQPPTHDYEYDD